MPDQKDVYELTPMQRAMLRYTHSAAASAAYFEQICYAFQGQLDVRAFVQAWQRVINRHPILRTSFYFETEQRPVQIVHTVVELPFVEHDWRALSAAAQAQRLTLLLEEDRRRGFDLSRAPLIRLVLIRTDEEAYRFVLSHHHIIMDGWSLSLVRSEVSQLYKAGRFGGAINLESARGFSEYVEYLTEQSETGSNDFWERELLGFTRPNKLEIDNTPAGPPLSDLRFGERETLLPPWLTTDLQSFAGSHRLTMSTLIQGAWAVLLGRYCGSDDVVFGVTVSGRPPQMTGIESMVGSFVNIQPRRVRIYRSDLIWSYFKNLQSLVAVQLPYEHVSMEHIQHVSQVPHNLPLCETLVVFENFQAAASPLDLGEQMTVTGAHLARTSYPLTLVAHPGTQLRLQLIYHQSRFADEAIEKLLGDLSMMLEDMVEDPDRTIESLALLEAAGRSALQAKWNANGQRAQPDHGARGLRLLPSGERKAG